MHSWCLNLIALICLFWVSPINMLAFSDWYPVNDVALFYSDNSIKQLSLSSILGSYIIFLMNIYNTYILFLIRFEILNILLINIFSMNIRDYFLRARIFALNDFELIIFKNNLLNLFHLIYFLKQIIFGESISWFASTFQLIWLFIIIQQVIFIIILL